MICLVAGVGLLAVMGVTVFKNKRARKAPSHPVRVAAPVAAPEPAPYVAPRPRPVPMLRRVKQTIREIERKMPTLRRAVRGEDFEPKRVDLLSQAADVRDELGAWLDRHPSDEQGQRLWDRVLRAYVALKKL